MRNITLTPQKVKGSGKRTALSLSGEQKANLLFWVKDNREACCNTAAHELAKIAGEKLGFPISPSSILWAKNSAHPDLRRYLGPRGSSQASVIARLKQRVDTLESIVEKLTKDLGFSVNDAFGVYESAASVAQSNGVHD